jgi:hypothetical protein
LAVSIVMKEVAEQAMEKPVILNRLILLLRRPPVAGSFG